MYFLHIEHFLLTSTCADHLKTYIAFFVVNLSITLSARCVLGLCSSYFACLSLCVLLAVQLFEKACSFAVYLIGMFLMMKINFSVNRCCFDAISVWLN